MTGASSALTFIVQVLFDLYALVIGLRFIMQARGVSPFNQISQMVIQLTNPPLKPLQRLVPRAWGYDLAALLLCFLVFFIGTYLINLLEGFTISNPALIAYLAFKKVVELMFNIFIFSMVVYALLSWFIQDPRHPVFELTGKISNPVVEFVRRFIPPISGIDLSFLFGIIGLSALKIFVLGVLP